MKLGKAPPPKEQTVADLAKIAEGKGPETPFKQHIVPTAKVLQMGRTTWRCDQSKWPFGKGQPFCDNTANEIRARNEDALKTINTGKAELPEAAAFVSEDPEEDKLGDAPDSWFGYKGPAETPPYPGNTNSK
jgi:hypothetical protein